MRYLLLGLLSCLWMSQAIAHPLDPLTADEQAAAVGLVGALPEISSLSIPNQGIYDHIELKEPSKSAVLNGDPVPREALITFYNIIEDIYYKFIVDVTNTANPLLVTQKILENTRPA